MHFDSIWNHKQKINNQWSMSCSSDSSIDHDNSTLILDNGSASVHCGFAGDDAPRIVLPNIVGKPRYRKCMIGCNSDYYIGDAAQCHRGLLSLKYPVQHGIVTDWDAMEKIWYHIFKNELKIWDENDFRILITEAIFSPKKNREKMLEILFEKFQFSSVYVSSPFPLSLYSVGHYTGTVVDIGEGVTQIVPVWFGSTIGKAWNRSNIAGSDLTQYLMTLLDQRGNCFTTSAEYEIVRDIKEEHCYVAADFDKEMQTSAENLDLNKKYKLPDGQFIDIGDERFRCPEALFRPDMIGSECLGIHELTYDTLMKCDIDLRKDLYSGIFLSGGSTMFTGLKERLTNELSALLPSRAEAKVTAYPERKYHVWIGGSILATLNTPLMWLSEDKYREYGNERLLKWIHEMI